MSKGLFLFLLALALLVGGGFFVIPRLKRSLIGESWLVTIKPLMVSDEIVETPDGDDVPKTVASLEIDFPMGSAPDSAREFEVLDIEGHSIEVVWGEVVRDDFPDKARTRWIVKEVFFPPGFRQGTLKIRSRELGQIRLPQPPMGL